MSPRHLLLACASLGLLLSGCASKPREIGGAQSLSVVDTGVLPAPKPTDYSGALVPTYLGPTDLLQISVAGVDFLSGQEMRVDSGGEISFPLVGGVKVAGLSPREVESVLRERLITNGRMVDPKVSVNVKEFLSQAITIEGQVRRPGIYPISRNMTLLKAVALGQGTNEFSDLDDVVIFRTVDGVRYAALYDLDQIRHGAHADPQVFPNDIIMVGDERGRRVFQDLVQTFSPLASPIIIALDRLVR